MKLSFEGIASMLTRLCVVSTSAQVKVFVTGLFSLNQDIPAFKEHLRDFLVQIKVRPASAFELCFVSLSRHRGYCTVPTACPVFCSPPDGRGYF